MNSLSNIRVGGAAAGAVSEQMGAPDGPLRSYQISLNPKPIRLNGRGADYLFTGFKSHR